MAKTSNVTTDPIADMLTRIRNAISARHSGVTVPHSIIKASVAKILTDEGFIKSWVVKKDEKGFQYIEIEFKPDARVIQGLRRISKPGLRVYVNSSELPRVLNGLGIAIISTSKGVMTDANARKANIGGEVLAYIW